MLKAYVLCIEIFRKSYFKNYVYYNKYDYHSFAWGTETFKTLLI